MDFVEERSVGVGLISMWCVAVVANRVYAESAVCQYVDVVPGEGSIERY